MPVDRTLTRRTACQELSRQHFVLSKSDLWPNERKLIDAIRSVRFGRVVIVGVCAGELRPEMDLVVQHKHVFGKSDDESPHLASSDFGLKQQHWELILAIRGIEHGSIEIEVANGLPTSWVVETTQQL